MQQRTRRGLERDLEQYSETARAVRRAGRGGAKDWARYTAAAGSALGMASAAEAAIVYSGVQNITLTRGTTNSDFQAVDVDLDGTAPDELALQLVFATGTNGGTTYSVAFAGLNDGANADFLINASSRVRRLSSGATIGASGTFGFGGTMRGQGPYGTPYGTWPGGNPAATTGFAGIVFSNGGTTHFGWLRLQLRNDAAGLPDQLVLVDWAYQTVDNASIQAGQVPEPSSLALLAAGTAGIAAYRRRRKSAR